MLKIGITGGIGSGKSTVCKLFEQLGIPVYNADAEAKQLMKEDAALRKQITQLFGPDAYLENGELNRVLIGQKAFNNSALLEELNAAVHPAVTQHFLDWANRFQNKNAYVVKEAALIFEAGTYKDLDFVINVSAPLRIRLRRVMERDGVSEEDVKKRMKKQMSERKRNQLSDFIIKNDGKHALIPQVLQLHEKFLNLSTSGIK